MSTSRPRFWCCSEWKEMPLGCSCLYYIREQASATTWTLDRISYFEWTSLNNCNIAEVQSSKVLVLHISPAVSRVRKRRMRSSFSRFQTTNYKVLDWSWLFLVIISTVLTLADKIRSEVKDFSSPPWRCQNYTAERFGPNITWEAGMILTVSTV